MRSLRPAVALALSILGAGLPAAWGAGFGLYRTFWGDVIVATDMLPAGRDLALPPKRDSAQPQPIVDARALTHHDIRGQHIEPEKRRSDRRQVARIGEEPEDVRQRCPHEELCLEAIRHAGRF